MTRHLISSMALLLAFASALHAQSMDSATAKAPSTSDWALSCSDTACLVSRSVMDANSGQRIASVFFNYTHDKVQEIAIAVPLGVVIEPGLKLSLGDKDLDLKFEVCFPDGCRARRILRLLDEDRITGTETLDILAFPYGQGTPIKIAVPTDGLKTALEDARRKARALSN
ncbi:invasion associated locus B family protein [Pacificoceanicola onchidii]|uniref:invasion associated locus B family protein n=1 Tax=Pacificoceanicola onchidii TaxID=2562685 RepID=UPI0010A351D7|nr:invasion associated locus B family protein [Pacificoceanicola onchidii]